MSVHQVLSAFENKKRYDQHVECIGEHLNKQFKSDEITVFHELLSLDFHLDVYFVQPKGRAYNILLTCGMSLFEMTVDERVKDPEQYRFAELMILLPKDLKLDMVQNGEGPTGWIVSMLKQTARFPHHYDTYLGVGHTIQATEDLKPYSDYTKFVGAMILPSVTFKSDFTEVKCGGRLVNIYGLFPLYQNELEYKIKNGFGAFAEKLSEGNPKEIIDNNRKNLINEGGILGFFKRR
jgi:hypothetical protein